MNATTNAAETTETETAFAPIKVDIDDGQVGPDCSGARACLLLDPEGRDVTVWYGVGPGCPEAVWHRRMLTVALNPKAEGENVRAIVEAHLDTVAAIFDLYEGQAWDGSNHVGTWGGDENGVGLDLLTSELEEALAEAATYWDASEWLAPAWYEVKAAVREALVAGRGLDDLAAEWARDGANDGALVHAADIRSNFDKAAEELRAEGDEAIYVVRGAGAATLGDTEELPDARAFGETWRCVEATNGLDAVLKARALDGADASAELDRLLGAWDEDYVARLAAHLGRSVGGAS